MRFVVLGSLLASLSPSWATAQVELGEFNGPRSAFLRRVLDAQIREAGIDVLDPSSTDEASIKLELTTSRRGSRWRARGRAVISGGESERLNASGRSIGALARSLTARVQALMPVDATMPRVGLSIGGPGGARVERALATKLVGVNVVFRAELESQRRDLGLDLAVEADVAALARAMNLQALVAGSIRREGRRLSGRLEVREGVSGRVLGHASIRGSSRRVGSTVRRPAEALMLLIHSAEAAPAQEVPAASDSPAASPRSVDTIQRPRFTPAPKLPTAFEVGVGGVTFTRSFAPHDDPYESDSVRAYSLGGAFALALDARWYPAAHFTSAWPANIGLDASYTRAIGLRSSRSSSSSGTSDTRFETSSSSFHFGLRGRIPLGNHEISAALAGGRHWFVVANNQRAEDEDNLAEMPGVDYLFMRAGLLTRFAFGKFSLSIGAAYRHIFQVGGIGSDRWFPSTEAWGVEAMARTGYSVAVGTDSTLELWVGFEYLRYAFDHHTDGANLTDAPWVGGALDQYNQVRYGLTWRR